MSSLQRPGGCSSKCATFSDALQTVKIQGLCDPEWYIWTVQWTFSGQYQCKWIKTCGLMTFRLFNGCSINRRSAAFGYSRELMRDRANSLQMLWARVGAYKSIACLITGYRCASRFSGDVLSLRGSAETVAARSRIAMWLGLAECPVLVGRRWHYSCQGPIKAASSLPLCFPSALLLLIF